MKIEIHTRVNTLLLANSSLQIAGLRAEHRENSAEVRLVVNTTRQADIGFEVIIVILRNLGYYT